MQIHVVQIQHLVVTILFLSILKSCFNMFISLKRTQEIIAKYLLHVIERLLTVLCSQRIVHGLESLYMMHGFFTVNKAQQLLQGLQSTGNEDQQLTAAIEMCQVLQN